MASQDYFEEGPAPELGFGFFLGILGRLEAVSNAIFWLRFLLEEYSKATFRLGSFVSLDSRLFAFIIFICFSRGALKYNRNQMVDLVEKSTFKHESYSMSHTICVKIKVHILKNVFQEI